MALVPRTQLVDQQPAGAIPGQFAPLSEAAPGDGGAAAWRALSNAGEQLQRTGGVLAQNAIKEQDIINDTEATEAQTALSRSLNEAWAEYSEKQGQDAVQAFPGFVERVRSAGAATLAGVTNPRVRQMLAARVGQLTEGMVGSATTWNNRQGRVANADAQTAGADQAIAEGVRQRTNPNGLAAAVTNGLERIQRLGDINGWDATTLAQRQAEYRGRFYSAVIASVAEGDPIAGQRMFEAVRDQLDAGAVVRIENFLSTPVNERRALDIVRQVTTPTAAADAPGGMRDRVWQAEGGAAANPTPGQTARGGGITDGTWNAYAARLNLRPEQRGTREGFNAVWDAYQSDARREIGRDLTEREQYTAWFLGIAGAKAFITAPRDADARATYAAVARPAIVEQAFRNNGSLMRDGMTVGQVLDAVGAALPPARGGAPGATPGARGDQSEMMRRGLEMAGDNVRLRASFMSQFAQWSNIQNATMAQERAGMERRITELTTALGSGAAGLTIPEADIRRIFQPEQADRYLDQLNTAQVAGQVFAGVQLSTPQELQTLREDLQNGSGPVSEMLRQRRGTRLNADGTVVEEDRAGDIAVREQMRGVLDRKIEQRNEQLRSDPAQFVLADPTVRAAATAAAADPSNAQAMADYVTATHAAQARLGIPEQDRRVLSKAQAQAIASDLMRAEPSAGSGENPDGPARRLRSLEQAYGANWPAVFRDLQRDGNLPANFRVLANIPSAVGQADFARMMSAAAAAGGMDKLAERLPSASRQQIEREVSRVTEAFTGTAAAMQTAGGDRLATLVHSAVRDLATYYALRGQSPADAMQAAADRIINDKYEILGTMRVPRTLQGGQPLGLAPVMRAQATIMRGLTPEALADVAGNPQVPADERRRQLHASVQRGQWVPNENDTGLVLMRDVENGGRLPVMLREGGRVELFFDRLPPATVQGMSSFVGSTPLNALGRAPNLLDGPPNITRGLQAEQQRRALEDIDRQERERGSAPRRQGDAPAARPPGGPAPPVRPVLPGDARGARGSQPRGTWEPPQ